MSSNSVRPIPVRNFKGAAGVMFGAIAAALLAPVAVSNRALADTRPLVVEVELDDMVQPISAEYIARGIRYANENNANAVLLEIDTPGGFMSSMGTSSCHPHSRVPVITYVSPRAPGGFGGIFHTAISETWP